MRKKHYFLLSAVCLLMNGCQKNAPVVSLGIEDRYYIRRMQKLALNPALTGKEYRWTIKTAEGKDSIVCRERSYIFLTAEEKSYDITFEIIDPVTPYKHSFRINVLHEEVEYSRYISKVYEYRPAPGQFINTMPEYQEGDTEETMCKKAEECISGKIDRLISLGAYGGYVTFGFDHTVMNVKGKKDFMIIGNAFYSDIPSYSKKKGGSCEPGIVMVAFDKNLNGKPDENEWYELAGSEYYKPATVWNYEITYRRSDPDKTYILWEDNQGKTEYIAKNKFHNQDYYPKWIKQNTMFFKGTRLAANGVDESGNGNYYVLYSYEWGYADNHPKQEEDLNSFDIDWAVDKNGNPVYLPGIDFIRVYTAVNQYCGRLGETSTEISRAEDLHIENPSLPER